MPKVKLTLTVDKDVVRIAKSRFALQNISISEAVEDLLESYTDYWIERMMNKLGVKKRYVSYRDVIKNRPKGVVDSGKILREMRDARANSVFG
jgi:hypothetical protein